jgi:hypothetical protein
MAVPWVPFQRGLCQRGHMERVGTLAAGVVVCRAGAHGLRKEGRGATYFLRTSRSNSSKCPKS